MIDEKFQAKKKALVSQGLIRFVFVYFYKTLSTSSRTF